MTTIKGPAIFIAQFIGDTAPFNSLESICKWAAGLGYKGVQLPTNDARFIDLQKAAESKTYADEIKGSFQDNPGVQQYIKQMEKVKPVSIGHKAPDFTTGGIDGKPVKLSDYKGKYVMIDFWASWCMPCRQENPNVVKQYNAFKSKGFNILGISLDKETGAWKKAIDDDKLTWAHGSDLKGFEGPTETLYHIEAIPSNLSLILREI